MQTVLITGGSRGIGAQTVRAFSRAGWRAAFTYLSSEEKAAALSRETGALALRCDARSEAETEEMARRAQSSGSGKIIYSPLACSIPLFRAEDKPSFFL